MENILNARIEKLESVLEKVYNDMDSLQDRRPFGFEQELKKLEVHAAEGKTRIKEVKFCIKLLSK